MSDPTELEYVYTPVDESVLADIELHLGNKFGYVCYYGEFEGKHVFFAASPFAAVGAVQIGAFSLYCSSLPILQVWDGKELVEYWDKCDIFSFESAKEIAFIHLNHMINKCGHRCTFKSNEASKLTNYVTRWVYMVGITHGSTPRVILRTGNYAMLNYCAEQEPLFSGDMGFLACNLGVMEGETKERSSLFVTVENVLGFDEKFGYYGTLADVLEMYEITEDMWLDSYDGFNTSENFDLKKAKTLKYCVPIHPADSTKLDVEICLVVDNDKDGNYYILVMRKNEETGKKYISQIYHYKLVEEQ